VVDVIGVVQDSYELYKESWRKVVTAFIVIFLIGVIAAIVNFAARLSEDTVCKVANNPMLVLLFCLSPVVLQLVLGVVGGLISNLITIAVIIPVDEIVSKKTVSNWTKHFSPQLLNAIKVMVVRALISLIIFAPVIVLVIGSISALVALKNNANPTLLLGGGLLLIVILLIVSVIVWSIAMFLLTFLEIEIVLGGGGVFSAISRSANLVKENFADVFVFSILWFFIRYAMGILNLLLMCTVCLIPLAFAIPSFVVEPIELMSKVELWRKLTKSS
jgi:hypothetical protein